MINKFSLSNVKVCHLLHYTPTGTAQVGFFLEKTRIMKESFVILIYVKPNTVDADCPSRTSSIGLTITFTCNQ